MPYLLIQRERGEVVRQAFDSVCLRAGRSDANAICLRNDPSISRHHIEFTREANRYFVRDVGSRSGTRVNGSLITGPVELRRGDRIAIGHTVMHFLLEGDHEPSPLDPTPAHSATELPGRGSARLSPDPIVISPIDGARVSIHISEIVGSTQKGAGTGASSALETASRSRAFEILSQASETFLGQQSLDAVLEMCMDMVHRAAAPDRAAAMLLEGQPPSLKVRAHRGGAGTGADTIRISRTITDAVLHGQTAVLVSDATVDARFAGAESVMLEGVRSAMCVPLWNNKAVIGLIYVDRLRSASAYSGEDLRVLTLVANLAAIKIENVRLFLRDQKMKELEREMATAAKIQQRLLPSSVPGFAGYELAGRNLPCLAVGGDYFDLQLRDEGRLMVAIGDVSGKGLGAALLMALVQGAVRANIVGASNVPDLVSRLNHVVLTNSGDEQFMTLFCCEIDGASGSLRYVNAGHNPPLLFRRNGQVERLFSRGMALGILPDRRYEQAEVALEHGDLLALYSDGITESQDPSSAEFGEDRLLECLRELHEQPVGTILERVLDSALGFAGTAPQFDDMTLVLVRRPALPRPDGTHEAAARPD